MTFIVRRLFIVLLFLPHISFADVHISQYRISLDKKIAHINEIINLTIKVQGSIENFTPNQQALVYPKILNSESLKIVNVKVKHTLRHKINSNVISKKPFGFTLIYQFKAQNKGLITIPNLPISFAHTSPFLITPQKKIRIIQSYFDNHKTALLLLMGFFITLFVFLWIKYKPSLNRLENKLEITTYKRFIKIKTRLSPQLSQQVKELIIKHINKKLKKRLFSLKQNSLDITLNEIDMDIQDKQKIERLWNQCSEKQQWSKKNLTGLDESFKTFLFLFQDIKVSPGFTTKLILKNNS